MLDVPASPRRAHLATRRVLHALEHPPVHLALPSVSQALRRSLEPALFLDEPQNGLDPDGIASLSETLRAYRDKGNCVVISTHLLHEIQGVPDECIMIRHGRAVQVTDLTGVNLADLYQGR